VHIWLQVIPVLVNKTVFINRLPFFMHNVIFFFTFSKDLVSLLYDHSVLYAMGLVCRQTEFLWQYQAQFAFVSIFFPPLAN